MPIGEHLTPLREEPKKEHESAPFSPEEFFQGWKRLREQLLVSEDAYYEIAHPTQEQQTAYIQEKISREQAYIDSLLEQAARFKCVFQTEKGSYYFQFSDGTTQRIKRRGPQEHEPEAEGYHIQPRTDFLFSVTEETVEWIKSTRPSPDEFLGTQIPILLLDLGLCPFEIGITSDRRRPVVEKQERTITINGFIREGFEEDGLISSANPPTHVGHKITKLFS